MRKFSEIRDLARGRHGEEALEDRSGQSSPKSPAELAAIPDDRYLSMATRCIFQAGFNWKVIDAKWEGFEQAFAGFDPGRWLMANDDDIAELLSDTRIVRNGQKIATVPHNARFFVEVAREHGGVGRWIGDWPVADQIGLMAALDKGGARLGGATGQYFLRFMGKDCFILSQSVVAALTREGVIEGKATSKKALAAIQDAFNRWADETGYPVTWLSRILAKSIDA